MSRSATRSSGRWGAPALALLLAAVAPATAAARVGAPRTAAPAQGKVLLTLEEALALCFGDAQVERGTVYLTEAQRKEAERLAREELESAIQHPYVARRDGRVIGTAWVDAHRVRSLRETLMVVVGPDQRVLRVELLAFGEPEEYVPRGNWYGQFTGRRLDDELDLKRGIRGITGATLTARATTSAVRRVLAVHRVLHGPPPEPPPGDGAARGGGTP